MNDMFKQREAFISHLHKKMKFLHLITFAVTYGTYCLRIFISCFKKLIKGQCNICHVVMNMNMCHNILLVYYGCQVFHLYMCMSCLSIDMFYHILF